jgi:CheY-like chemotaxis protein
VSAPSYIPVVLLAEDDPGDVLMITEALERTGRPRDIRVVGDGQEALDYLYRSGAYAGAPRPDLILLDLNMPRLDGRQALEAIKADADLRVIPIVVLTTSAAEADISSSYDRHANAYVTKPLELDAFDAVVQQIDRFYTSVSVLPPPGRRTA